MQANHTDLLFVQNEMVMADIQSDGVN